MKKVMFLGSFLALSLAFSPAWADSYRNNGGSEANATALQQTNVNVVTPTPQINNSSSSNTTVGVGINNSPSNSVGINNSPSNSVGINNSPTNNNQSSVSGSGNSLSFSQGGSSKSSSSVSDSGNSVLILDQSQNGIEYQNRQHIGTPGVGSAPAAQMFDAWEQGSWNVSPITAGAFEQGFSKEKIEFVKLQERFFVKGDPSSKIVLRGTLYSQADKKSYYLAPSGKKVGTMSMVMPEDKTVDDALLYAASVGMANGADQIEVIQYGGRKMPTVEGYSVGFGSGASGLMGDGEKIAVGGGGGTNFSKSSIVKEEQPWLSVAFWKNGDAPKQAIKVAPLKEEPPVNKLDKKKAIN